ncbi:hypothetical protein QR680_018703 [Steinernema hermaphroditum]|uniref:Uncharacterized protein n=1 Tax=Steinernema hermaphroditum TaxID=289476 RepID=A0AA39LRH8_9BILA|nr:hypothetical protein QR680_018703 [Steinernema hermaphroditum]
MSAPAASYGYLLLEPFEHYYSIGLFVVSGLSLLISTCFIFIIATKSPCFMKTYKYLLLNMYLWCIVSVVLLGVLVQPTIASPFTCLKILGLAKFLLLYEMKFFVFFMYIALGNFTISAALIFFYKATVVYPRLPKVLTRTSVRILLAVVIHVGITVFVILMLTFSFTPSKAMMKEENSQIFCLDFYMGTAVPLFPINYVLFMVGTTVACCMILAKIVGSQTTTGRVSKRRTELNRKMNVTLVVLLAVTVAMGFFPCTVIVIFMMTGFNYTNVVMFVAMPAAICIPICDSIVLVSFIRPYQKAFLSFLSRLTCHNK